MAVKKKYRIIHVLILIFIAIIFLVSKYVYYNFSQVYFEEMVFYFKAGVQNMDKNIIITFFQDNYVFIVLLSLGMYALFYDISFGFIKCKWYPFKVFSKHKKLFTFYFFIISIFYLSNSFNLFNYLKYTCLNSSFIEENYVDPRNVKIEFLEKRNLVVIVAESLETTFFTEEQGGKYQYDVTPELYKLLKDDDTITFYNENIAQGTNMIQGASWTTSSVVANSAGIPFKVRIGENHYHSENFLNGSYALGDLLLDNGYYNELISSARTSFGGIKEYFTRHGNYQIIDVDSLDEYGLKMESSDKGNWGFNDNYLFEIAKQRLTTISKYDRPFNMELITIDTHYTDGFIGDYSENRYDAQYENVYATESKLIYDFVLWMKKQDFYDNTTILIVGDHLSMQDSFFSERKISSDDRYIYNCIINPVFKTNNNSNRVITALDTYPTIVTAIGGEIEGDKLGLGVNLFSDGETLAEKYGVEQLSKILQKKSKYYDDKILNDYTIYSEKKNG